MFARTAGLALLLCTAAFARPPLPETKGHDLRGPALKKGLVLTIKTTTSLKDSEVELTGPDGSVTKTKTSNSQTTEYKCEVLAVEGRAVTKQRVTFIKMKSSISVDGKEMDVPIPAEETPYLCEKVKGEWKVKPEKGEAGETVKTMAGAVPPWTTEDELYPARRVKVGESWEVGAKALQAAFGESARMTDVTGKMKGKLRAVEKYQGELCAIVEFDARIKGKVKTAGQTAALASTSKLTVYRSLASGITLKSISNGDMASSFGGPAAIKVKGKEKRESVTTVKRR